MEKGAKKGMGRKRGHEQEKRERGERRKEQGGSINVVDRETEIKGNDHRPTSTH